MPVAVPASAVVRRSPSALESRQAGYAAYARSAPPRSGAERVDAGEEAPQQAGGLLGALDLRDVAAALEHDLLGARAATRSTWRRKPAGISVSCVPQTNSAGGASSASRG